MSSDSPVYFLMLVQLWLLAGGLICLLCVALMMLDDLLIWRDWMNRGAERFVASLRPQLRQFGFNRGRTQVHGEYGI